MSFQKIAGALRKAGYKAAGVNKGQPSSQADGGYKVHKHRTAPGMLARVEHRPGANDVAAGSSQRMCLAYARILKGAGFTVIQKGGSILVFATDADRDS